MIRDVARRIPFRLRCEMHPSPDGNILYAFWSAAALVEGRILQGDALILETYGPREVSRCQDPIKELKTARLIGQE